MDRSFKQSFLVFFLCFLSQIGFGDSVKCGDPSTPNHGSRIPPYSGPFLPGKSVRFVCDPNFNMHLGTTKMLCGKDGKWIGKAPQCIADRCGQDPPFVPHASLATRRVISHAIGTQVKYKCDDGYGAVGSWVKICGKDGNWIGNINCTVVTCGKPPQIDNASVTYRSLNYSSKANYTCNRGYVFRDTIKTYTEAKCQASGQWQTSNLKCIATCPVPKKPDHGSVRLYPARSVSASTATFACDDSYKMRGSMTSTCLRHGEWSSDSPTCVIFGCGSPGNFSNPHGPKGTYNASEFQFYTVVEFKCVQGYRLFGPASRQCLVSGQWSKAKNPECQRIACEEPGEISHGHHIPEKDTYWYGTVVHYFCDPRYYIYGGSARRRCTKTPDDVGRWDGSWPPRCLSLSAFEERCKEDGNKLIIDDEGQPSCEEPTNYPTDMTTTSRRNQNLDTLTIVTASAGSTLGALVILLSVLICLKKLARRRRVRRHSSRGRHYSNDDRIAFIATYTGDVHFILPSYDEAMSQVERSPPPFDSVVSQGAERSTNTNNNDATVNEDLSAGVRDNPNAIAAFDNPLYEPSSDSERQINIVSNPLAGGETGDTAHAQITAASVGQGGLSRSECSQSETDSDSGNSETQPLIGEADRGVMV